MLDELMFLSSRFLLSKRQGQSKDEVPLSRLHIPLHPFFPYAGSHQDFWAG